MNTNVALCPGMMALEVGIAATVKLGESAVFLSGIDRSGALGDRPAQLQTERVSIDSLLNLMTFGPRAAIK
jgi:hypothetical protein